jgi:multicomponent Na+:H+ antiporter subunit G
MDLVRSIVPYVADLIVVLGIAVMTLGVYGILRMPDVYTKLHAASKAVFLGAIALAVASFVTGEPAIIFRVILISAILVITTPIASHVIAYAAVLEREPMRTPGAIDESPYKLNERTESDLERIGLRGLRDSWRLRQDTDSSAGGAEPREANSP